MNRTYFKLLKHIVKTYGNKARDVFDCLCSAKTEFYNSDVTLETVIMNHDYDYVLKIVQEHCIEKKQLNNVYYNQEEAFFNFFIKEAKCPECLENCEEIRKLYFEKLENMKNTYTCTKCAENNLKIYFISNYLKSAFKRLY